MESGYIEFPDELRLNGIALDTKEEPYELRVTLKGTKDVQMKYIAMSSVEAWKSASIILFSLIDNLSNIEYVIDDGVNNIGVAIVDRQYADDITMSVMGYKTNELTKNKARFKEFYEIFSK